MKQNIIFFGGIHGVGKSTLCLKLSKKLNIPHYIVSDILKKYKKLTSSKIVHKNELNDNQNFLIKELSSINEDGDIILDGHLVLFGENQRTTKIPLEYFKKINPKLIIVLHDLPLNIHNRLLHRDKARYSIEILNRMQIDEINWAKTISDNLNIPLHLIGMNRVDDLNDILDKIK